MWEQRDRTCLLYGRRQLALVSGTVPRDPRGDQLATLGKESCEHLGILIVEAKRFVGTEAANLSAAEPTSWWSWIRGFLEP